MMSKTGGRTWPSYWKMAICDGTPRKAFFTALIVGTILVAINHGDLLATGTVPPLAKVALTYCVPYCVTTWGAITGKLALLRRQLPEHDAGQ